MSVPWYLMAKGKGGGGYKTASGPIVSISDALAAPLRALRVGIDPVQAGTGDPSPDNVRPISGWDSVTAWRTGKNLYNMANQTTSSSNTYLEVDVKPNTDYVFSVDAVQNALYVQKKDGNNWTTFYVRYTVTSIAFNTGDNSQIRLMTYNSAGNPTQFQLELGSTPTSYSPYTGNQFTIQLGQTVYGGTRDVIGGVLTVDRAMASAKKVHFSSKITGTVMDYRQAGSFPPTASLVDWNKARQQQISNMAKIANPNSESNYGNYVAVVYTASGTSVGSLRISEDLYQSMSDDDEIEVVYKLLNPIEYTLTPQQLDTLAGQNVVWADSGDVTVEYLSAGGANPDLMKLAVAFMGRK